MSWLVLLRPRAEDDLAAAREWYEQKIAGLGDEFLDEFAAAMRRLEADPERERLYYRNFRRVLFRRFPYKVFYQVIGERVIVFRVLHAKQEHERRLSRG
jgi:plasmid stabilization system protein ParE